MRLKSTNGVITQNSLTGVAIVLMAKAFHQAFCKGCNAVCCTLDANMLRNK